MSYRIKYIYPDGEIDYSDESFETEQEAEWEAEDSVLGFATGAEILEDMGRDFYEGSLEYEIFEE